MSTIGLEHEIRRKITAKDVQTFSELTGDHNPVHVGSDAVIHGAFLVALAAAAAAAVVPNVKVTKIEEVQFPKATPVDTDVLAVATIEDASRKLTTCKLRVTDAQNCDVTYMIGQCSLRMPKK